MIVSAYVPADELEAGDLVMVESPVPGDSTTRAVSITALEPLQYTSLLRIRLADRCHAIEVHRSAPFETLRHVIAWPGRPAVAP